MKNHTTIYQRLQAFGKPYSKSDLTRIGMRVSQLYQLATGDLPEKMLQKEGTQTFKVRVYPVEFAADIDNIIEEYFAAQRTTEKRIGETSTTNKELVDHRG